jgi:hypothetical protein
MYLPINETLPATGNTPVEVTIDSAGCAGYIVQARGSVDMLISSVSFDPTTDVYWTVKSGGTLAIDEVLGPNATVLYAVSSGAADTIELVKVRL